MRRLGWLAGFVAVQALCVWVVEPDVPRLLAGLPRLARWLGGAFPPDFSGLDDLLRRAAETWPDHVWLNPIPEAHWRATPSIGMIEQLFAGRMMPLTLDGLTRAMRVLG